MSTFFVNFAASLALVCTSTAAFAHARLQKATPDVGGTVASASEISLKFSEGVEPPFSGLALTAAGGSPCRSVPQRSYPAIRACWSSPSLNRWRGASTRSTGMQSRSTPIRFKGTSTSP